MPSSLPDLNYAVLTDVGRRRLANEDAVSADARMGLFVVCDGIGGRPSGEAASQIVAHATSNALRRQLRGLRELDEPTLKRLLVEASVAMNQQMYQHSQQVPALVGMGCTMVAALLDARTVFYLHAGDSRLYLLRDGDLMPLSADHTHTRQTFKTEAQTGDLLDVGERRLIMQYIGSPRTLEPTVASLPLRKHDRLLLCSDGLTDPLNDETLHQLLTRHTDPDAATRALVKAANEAGGPDNITVAVIDYRGPRRVTAADRVSETSRPHAVPRGVAERLRLALAQLEEDLTWLKDGATESAHPRKLTALAATKRRLGAEAYRDFLSKHSDQSPSHVFHQSCTQPDSTWRRRYQLHMDELENALALVTEGGIRLSPVLNGEQTAQIYQDLWTGWRRVEQRYFATCQRPAISATEQTLNILIDHMLNSVQTLTGLLYFLPRFMRPETRTPKRRPPGPSVIPPDHV